MRDVPPASKCFRPLVLSSVLVLSAFFAPVPAFAQEDEVVVLAPITVTARKREEDEQDVPISMTVLEGDRLDVSPIASNADLAREVPNFNFVDLGGQASNFANIRGVGSFSPVAADDSSVVFYVDEIPQSLYGVAPSLMDVERVEVLRGPQGTLFGRNTQGGAVAIVPRRPTFDPELALTGEVGTNGYAFGELIANGALGSDTLAGRLAVSWSHYGGDIPNVVAGGKDGALDIAAARGTLLFDPTDRTEAVLSFSYGGEDTHSPRFLLRDAPDFPVSATDPRTHVDTKTYGVNLRIEHAFDAFEMTSLTSMQRNQSNQLIDLTDGLVFAKITGLPPAVFDIPWTDVADIDLAETNYLQEFRLSSHEGSEVAWTAGLNFYRTEATADRDAWAATPAFWSVNGISANEFTNDSYAAFGEVVVPVVDRLDATFGLRATHEDKSATYRFDGNGLPGVVPFYADDQSLTDDFLTGRAALGCDWSEDVTTYVSIARGYVSAGFPVIGANVSFGKPEQAFPASKSLTYETGFKSTLLDRRATLNGAVFFNDVQDGHLVVFDPTQALFRTTALDYRSYGGEIETTAHLTPALDLFGGIGYTHAELVNVPPMSPTGAVSGNEVPNVPALSANVGLEYSWSAGAARLPGDFAARLVYQYVGSRAADVANTFDLRAYSIVNARLTWESDRASVYAFARNLFDERYEAWGQSFGPVPTVRVGQGRVVGAGVSIRF